MTPIQLKGITKLTLKCSETLQNTQGKRPNWHPYLDVFNLHLINFLRRDGLVQPIVPEVIVIITLYGNPKEDSLCAEVGESVVPADPVVTLLTYGDSGG